MSRFGGHNLVILFVLLLAVACGQEEPLKKIERPVKTFTVAAPAAFDERVFSGQLEAVEGTGIGFQVSGRVESLNVKVGERKEKGAILASIDDEDYRNQYDDAAAQFAQAKQAMIRTQRLFEAGNASQSQLDTATAQSSSAEAAFNLTEKRLNDCVLLMPYSGLIGSVIAEEEQLVSAGQEIVTIQGEEGLEFEVGVPADLVGEVVLEMDTIIEIGGREELVYQGKVTEISPQVAQNTTYPIVISIREPDGRIRAGMDGVARLQLPVNHENAVLIPLQSVVSQAGKDPFVWLVEKTSEGLGRLKRNTVEIESLQAEGMIRVLSGLSNGDIIVSRGVHRVEEGLVARLESE